MLLSNFVDGPSIDSQYEQLFRLDIQDAKCEAYPPMWKTFT